MGRVALCLLRLLPHFPPSLLVSPSLLLLARALSSSVSLSPSPQWLTPLPCLVIISPTPSENSFVRSPSIHPHLPQPFVPLQRLLPSVRAYVKTGLDQSPSSLTLSMASWIASRSPMHSLSRATRPSTHEYSLIVATSWTRTASCD